MSGRVVHLITSLETGGAETALLRLVSQHQGTRHDPLVVSVTDRGPTAARIEALGVEVRTLGGRRGLPDPLLLARLTRLLRAELPSVLQTWMYHADLIGALAAPAAGSPAVAWNIRHSDLAPGVAKRTTILTARACARLSHRIPRAIVCCAESARRVHAALGYDAARMVVIPNGYDLNVLRPDPAARGAIRAELGIAPDVRLIGLVARFHPQKDHETFLRAATRVCTERDDVRFVLCGEGVDQENRALTGWLAELGIADRCHLLGRRGDIPAIQAALDVGCLASNGGEAFPNVVAEAMACAVPCAVTDVGDAAEIVGDLGRVVPPREPTALAAALVALLDLEPDARAALGSAARRRIADRYSLSAVARRYAELYDRLTEGALPCAA